MNGLQWLSALNWVVAIFYLALPCLGLVFGAPGRVFAIAATAALLLAAPHVYLALRIERGAGRGLQSVLAVVSMLYFPLGTAFGLFALWVLWFSEHRAIFDDAALADVVKFSADPQGAPAESDSNRTKETDFEYAHRLADGGRSPEWIYARLKQRGLDGEEIVLLFEALHLKLP